MKLQTTLQNIEPASDEWRRKARARLESLTMPYWALGQIQDLGEELAGMTRSMTPPVDKKAVVVMAADHGVTAEGVSKYPQEVTQQMVANFLNGGAGINALAAQVDADVCVVDIGTAGNENAVSENPALINRPVARGTNNIVQGPAMSRNQALTAVETGIETATQLLETRDILGTGDMGIGNTTPSAAVLAALTGAPVEDVTGSGTGIDADQLAKKVSGIKTALEVNQPVADDAVDVLAKVGGFEIGGIAGLILGAAYCKKPVVVDGFISTAGALVAKVLAPRSADYMIAAHKSVEKGHSAMHEFLGKKPLLDLNLRLGEGTGAALAMNLVEAARRVLTDVATFEEAEVSRKNENG